MPQELRVGHRSSLVSLLGLGLMVLGLLGGLLAVWRMEPWLGAALGLWCALALVTGHALWRRLEWALRASSWVLVSLVPVALVAVAVLSDEVPMLALVPLGGGMALGLSWALHRLNSHRVRQEFA